jgi:hypothetical protein
MAGQEERKGEEEAVRERKNRKERGKWKGRQN